MVKSQAEINVTVKVKQFIIDSGRVKKIACELGQKLGLKSFALDIAFVGEQKIRTLNRLHRGKDKPTDVLSFPMLHWKRAIDSGFVAGKKYLNEPILSPHLILGDVVVCPQYAKKNATLIAQSLSQEITFLLVHGLLHLCGHDHEDPKDEVKMLKEQKRLMAHLARRSKVPMWSNLVKAG